MLRVARAIASELAEFANSEHGASPEDANALLPDSGALADYDRRIVDPDLRAATRSRFVSMHYADAVEAAVKALAECVRARSGSILDGDSLMTQAFSEKNPRLRINRLRSDSDRSEQRGHMMMCQGVVAAWRNPRAHSNQFEDSPENALMMLEHVQHLLEVTKRATRTRMRRAP